MGRNVFSYLVGSHLDNIPMKFELRWQVQEELALKQIIYDFLFLALAPFCSQERNRFSYFGRGYTKQHSYVVSINRPRVKEELTFNFFSIFISGGHLVYRSGTILAILVGSHQGNSYLFSDLMVKCWQTKKNFYPTMSAVAAAGF